MPAVIGRFGLLTHVTASLCSPSQAKSATKKVATSNEQSLKTLRLTLVAVNVRHRCCTFAHNSLTQSSGLHAGSPRAVPARQRVLAATQDIRAQVPECSGASSHLGHSPLFQQDWEA